MACMAASLLTGCDLDLVEPGHEQEQEREADDDDEGKGRRRSRRLVSSWPL